MKKLSLLRCIALVFLAGSVVACSSDGDKEPPITGERLSVLELQRALEPDSQIDTQSLEIPAAWVNNMWPQSGGYPDHAMGHLTLSSDELDREWTSNAGQGSSKRARLNAEPVIVNSRIFTMDTDGEIYAFDLADDGDRIWRVNIRPENEDPAALTGGLGYGEGLLFVTDSYGFVLALNPENGEKVWQYRTKVPARAAPTVLDGRVFVVTLDNDLVTLDAKTGAFLWRHSGLKEMAGLLGAPSPAAEGNTVVVAYSSGEVYALRVENGQVMWSDNLSAVMGSYGGLSALSDIAGAPVISESVIYVASTGGRIVAIDQRSGERIWQRETGAISMPWLAGDLLYIITTHNELLALTRQAGKILWVKQLPRFEDEDDREDAITWTRPVLAGGRLIVAASDETVLEVDPLSGETVREWDMGDPAGLPPVVAGQKLYFLTDNGYLKAYK